MEGLVRPLTAKLRKMTEAYGAFAYAYDQSLGQEFFARVAPLLDRLIDAHPSPDRTHLDIACGTGLAMAHFTGRGFVSTGVDASLPMLSIARRRVPRLISGDLRALPLRGSFAWVTCLYDSLNHLLSRSDLVRAFRSIRAVMSDGALIVFDMNHPHVYRTVWSSPEPFKARGRDYALEIHTSYSRVLNLGVGRVTGWAASGGRRIEIDEERRQRAYSRKAIVNSLQEASFDLIDAIEFDPFPPDSGVDGNKAKWLFAARAK